VNQSKSAGAKGWLTVRFPGPVHDRVSHWILQLWLRPL